jgi:hypothetical protein
LTPLPGSKLLTVYSGFSVPTAETVSFDSPTALLRKNARTLPSISCSVGSYAGRLLRSENRYHAMYSEGFNRRGGKGRDSKPFQAKPLGNLLINSLVRYGPGAVPVNSN